MHVGVDKARQKHPIAEIDVGHSGRGGVARNDSNNAPVGHQDGRSNNIVGQNDAV